MVKCIKNCGECPFFEWFLEEFENGVGMVGKGRCHKWNQDEIWETTTPCSYAEGKSIYELTEESFQ